MDKPVILVINKIDGLSKEEIFNKILEYKDLYNWSDIVPVSALKDKNTGTLIKVIKEYLPESVKFFDNDTVTNRSLEFMASEIVREKILRTTSEEIPYSVTCVTTKFVKDKGNRIINVDIIVDRDSLKKIIIGKQGQKLKKIGIEARKDLEQILDAKVYLELYVKTIEKWRDREKYLNEFKFTDFTE